MTMVSLVAAVATANMAVKTCLFNLLKWVWLELLVSFDR